jgi:starvation-inducible DNA-binding protein
LLTAASYVLNATSGHCGADAEITNRSIRSKAGPADRDEARSDTRMRPSLQLVARGMTSTATSQTNKRRHAEDVPNFNASPGLTASLQRILVDLIELHLQGKQAHWNVVGANFRDLHLQLDEVVDAAREASDTIAERMRALDAVPDGRSDTVAATTTLPEFPAYEQNTAEVVDLIATRVYATVDTIRDVHDAVDNEDPSTADLLHQIIDSLEKLAWMIKSENRKI